MIICIIAAPCLPQQGKGISKPKRVWEEDYTVWSDRDPVNSEHQPVDIGFVAIGYVNRGVCHQNLKNYRKAIEDYNKGIEFDPFSMVAGYTKANLDDISKHSRTNSIKLRRK